MNGDRRNLDHASNPITYFIAIGVVTGVSFGISETVGIVVLVLQIALIPAVLVWREKRRSRRPLPEDGRPTGPVGPSDPAG